MKMVRWKRFIWDLTKLPPAEASLPAHFYGRLATPEDERAVREVILSAFLLDSTFSDTLKSFRPRIEAQITAAFTGEAVPVQVVTHGQRIVGASLLALDEDAESHLVSGPCVLAEYRNRGIGTALLHQSLQMLRESGLTRAFGVCKENAPTGKFVYRKYGSVNDAYDFNAALVATPR
jgi:ribosomal protein S18 acetylase RimI-like enzyme